MNPDRCSNCGAPLGEAKRTDAGLRCTYCDALAPLAAQASAASAAQPASATSGAQAPRPPAVFFSPPVQRTLRAGFAFGLGWWSVLLVLLFVRSGYGDVNPPIAGIATGLAVILWSALLGGRLPAGLYAFAAGVLFVLKPLLTPLRREDYVYSLDAEVHLAYSIPGGILIGLGALLVLTLSAERLRAKARDLRPSLVVAVCCAFGVGLALQLHVGETSDELHARFRPAYEARMELIREAASSFEGADLPAQALNLDPLPVLIDNAEDRSNTEALPLARVRDMEDDEGEYWLTGPLYQGLRRTLSTSWIGRHSGWRARDYEQRSLEGGLETRYLVLYRPDPELRELEAWLIDLEQGQVLLHVKQPQLRLDFEGGRAGLLDMLQKATGGTFRER